MKALSAKGSDRRTAIVDELARGLTTADRIAVRFQVSVRTVYRDIDALRRGGVRILGEAGVGYELRRPSA